MRLLVVICLLSSLAMAETTEIAEAMRNEFNEKIAELRSAQTETEKFDLLKEFRELAKGAKLYDQYDVAIAATDIAIKLGKEMYPKPINDKMAKDLGILRKLKTAKGPKLAILKQDWTALVDDPKYGSAAKLDVELSIASTPEAVAEVAAAWGQLGVWFRAGELYKRVLEDPDCPIKIQKTAYRLRAKIGWWGIPGRKFSRKTFVGNYKGSFQLTLTDRKRSLTYSTVWYMKPHGYWMFDEKTQKMRLGGPLNQGYVKADYLWFRVGIRAGHIIFYDCSTEFEWIDGTTTSEPLDVTLVGTKWVR